MLFYFIGKENVSCFLLLPGMERKQMKCSRAIFSVGDAQCGRGPDGGKCLRMTTCNGAHPLPAEGGALPHPPVA